MVAQETFVQAFGCSWDAPKVTADEVKLLVNGDLDEVRRRLMGSPFLPPYQKRKEREIIEWKAFGRMDEDEARRLIGLLNSEGSHFRKGDPQNVQDCYSTAQAFARLAFRLFELLQDVDDHPITWETIEALDVPWERSEDVTGEPLNTFRFDVPSCDYLQFVADGCAKLRRDPLHFDCSLSPKVDGEGDQPIVGWLLSTGGAWLECTAYDVPRNKRGPQLLAGWLLKFLLDLHLHDVTVAVQGVGEYGLLSAYSLPSLWVTMREELAHGKARVCRVCGRHFIATNERRIKARYCSPKGACSEKYKRTRAVLRFINGGANPKDAADSVKGISLKTAVDIALRNRYDLEREFPNVDFERLGEEI